MKKISICICLILLIGCMQKLTEIKVQGDPKKARILKVFANKSLTKLIFSWGFPHGIQNKKLPKGHVVYVYQVLGTTLKEMKKKRPFKIVKDNTIDLMFPLKEKKLYTFVLFQLNEKNIIIQAKWIYYVVYDDNRRFESLITEVNLDEN